MLNRSEKVNSIIRNYQAVVLMENLLGFREDFIRLIFQLALEANSQIEAKMEPSQHGLRIYKYLNELDSDQLVSEFRNWWKTIPTSDHGLLHEKGELEQHFRPIEAFLLWLPTQVRRIFKDFKMTSPPSADHSLFSAALSSFMDGDIFSQSLKFSTHGDFCRSLSGLFNLLLFTCDTTTEQIQLVKPVFSAGSGHEGEYEGYKHYLPHLYEQEFLSGGRLTELFETQWALHESFERISPSNTAEIGLRTGWTSFTYKTQWENNRDNELDFFLGNLNSFQLRPRPDLPLLGFFQMQSPVSGLVATLFPPEEFPNESRIRRNTQIQSLGDVSKDEHSQIRLIELTEDWYDQVKEDPTRMAFLKELRELGNPDWRDLLYKAFRKLNRMAVELRTEIEPLLVSDSIRRFAGSIMHELNGDLSRLKLHRDQPDLLDGLLQSAHFKVAGFYKFATGVVSSGIEIEDITLKELVIRVWTRALCFPENTIRLVSVDDPLWLIVLRGYQGDFDFALGAMIRNAAIHKLTGTIVSFHVCMIDNDSLELRWENITTQLDAQDLRNRLELAQKGLETGLLFAQEAAQRCFSSPLIYEIQTEGENSTVSCKFTLPKSSSSEDIFYTHPDCRVCLK